jgi:beta-lactamase regulating signal transducer with metallopeptidase domain
LTDERSIHEQQRHIPVAMRRQTINDRFTPRDDIMNMPLHTAPGIGFASAADDVALIVASAAATATVAATVALALCRLLAGRAAALRHGVLCTALAVVLLALPAGIAARWFGWGVAVRRGNPAPPRAPFEVDCADMVAAGDRGPGLGAAGIAAGPTVPPAPVAAVGGGPSSPAVTVVPFLHRLGLIACLVWAAGSLCGLMLLARDLVAVGRFVRSLVPCRDVTALGLLARAAASVGLARPPRLCESPAAVVPVVARPLAPVVVLPAGLVGRVPEGQLRAVFVHEAAHVARGDLWTAILQRLAAIAFWWCPPVHAINRRLADLREQICDNHLLRGGGAAQDLAAALVELAAAVPAHGWRLAPGMLGTLDERPGLVGRVERLLQADGRDDSVRMSGRARLAACLLALAAVAGAAATTLRAADDRPAIDLAPLTAGEVAAIDAALEWLAAHQEEDGRWKMTMCNSAGTGLAILSFLGRGHTHLEGPYKDRLAKGIRLLAEEVTAGKGSVLAGRKTMYSQAIVTLALCRAYGQSRDDTLAAPAQAALDFLIDAQDPVGGGWRYFPKQPGDTSVLGWVFPALASGRAAGLRVDPLAIAKVRNFLDGVAADGGETYGYVLAGAGSPTARAIGLLVRSRTGWKADDERIVRGAARVAATAPTDLYFAYHAAPLLEAVGGEKPQAWRKELRDALLAGQVRDGEHKGSWLDGFGGGIYIRDDRLMCTALATLALETPLVHRPATPVPENSP